MESLTNALYKFHGSDGRYVFGEGKTVVEACWDAGLRMDGCSFSNYKFISYVYEKVRKDDTMRCSCGTLNARGEWNSVVYCRKCGCLM